MKLTHSLVFKREVANGLLHVSNEIAGYFIDVSVCEIKAVLALLTLKTKHENDG